MDRNDAPLLPRTWAAPDGARIVLRRIGPADFDASRTFLSSLSYGTRYFRFGRGRFEYTDDELRALCEPDRTRRDQVVALAPDSGRMLGSARYVRADGDAACGDFAIVVADDWSGRGLGRALLAALIDAGREAGLRELRGRILGTNADMLGFVARMGFTLDAEGGPLRTATLTL
ncbi:MAG: GNAT family N-acetyltransferase [Burkholderiales bacterium]|jgi:acetyltransferase